MAETYTYQAPLEGFTGSGTLTRSDGAAVPCDLGNLDYQAFLGWLSEAGNAAPEGWTGPTNASPPPSG